LKKCRLEKYGRKKERKKETSKQTNEIFSFSEGNALKKKNGSKFFWFLFPYGRGKKKFFR